MKLNLPFFLFLVTLPLVTNGLENSTSDAKYVDGRAVQDLFVRGKKAIRRCYLYASKGTEEVPPATDAMVLDFMIEPEGKLRYMKLDPTRSVYKNEEVANCIAKRAASWSFPKLTSQKAERYFQALRFDPHE
jgi:hypothetical protein